MSDAYVALYRRYRPRKFSEVVGQEAVVRSLTASLQSGRFAHAYLFCGPRGTGKTSMARLLARAVNCEGLVEGEPCGSCPTCADFLAGRLTDVHEIDAASNRRIAEMRDLLEQVTYTPTRSRYKVYILDEAHMLTTDAANAFLKTLEEPPPHVLFVLATTEAHKILPTISSRCQVFEFLRIGEAACAALLEGVAQAEGVRLGEGVARFVALRAGGAMRDALALLERLISTCGEEISRDEAARALGLVPEDLLLDLARAVIGRQSPDMYRVLDQVTGQGRDARRLLVDLVSMVRDLVRHHAGVGDALEAYAPETRQALEGLGKGAGEGTRLLSILSRLDRGLLESRQALMPDFAVELTLLEAMHVDVVYDRAQVERRLSALESRPAPTAASPTPPPAAARPPAPASERPRERAPAPAPERAAAPAPRRAAPPDPDPTPTPPRPRVLAPPAPPPAPPEHAVEAGIELPDSTPPSAPPAVPFEAGSLEAAWRDLFARAKREHPITAGFLREATLRPAAGGVEVFLEAAFSFHHGKLCEAKHRAVLASLLQDVLGPEVSYELVLEGGGGSAGGRASPGAGRAPARTRPTREARDTRDAGPERPLGPSREAAPAGPGGGRDWYEDKALKHPRVQEALKTFEGEVLSVD